MRFNIHRLWKAKFLTIHRFARFIRVNHHFVDVEIFPVFWRNCTRLLRFLSCLFMLHYGYKT